MKIWVISSSYPRKPGESINAGVVARDLALEIAGHGHDVSVITPNKPGGVVFDTEIQGLTIPWWKPSVQIADLSKHPVDLLRALSLMLGAMWTIRRVVRERPPDGIIALWGLPSGIFARWGAKRARCPYVVWLLGSDVWRAGDIPGGISALRRVVNGARAALADGTQLAEEATRLTGTPVSFLPSARRLPKPTEKPGGQTDLLFVGRYHVNKGPDILMESLRMLHERDLHVRADFFGAGELEADLRTFAAGHGLSQAVTVNGPIGAQELSNLLTATPLLVIPSRIESVPLILGDAVQTRTRVIVSDVGDMGALVEDMGLGFSVPPHDPTSLALAIETALQGPLPEPDWGAADSLLSPSAAAPRLLLALGSE